MKKKIIVLLLYFYKALPPIAKSIILSLFNKLTYFKIKIFPPSPSVLSKPEVKEVNVIGSFMDHTGIGYQAREIANFLAENGYKVKLIHPHFQSALAFDKEKALEQLHKSIETADHLESSALKYPINIFSITFCLAYFYYNILAKDFHKYYNICYAPWELEYIRDSDINLFKLFNEIWTVSHFSKNAYEKLFKKYNLNIPIEVHHMHADVSNVSPVQRQDFNLPLDHFLFYFIFDPQSSIVRKNPFAIIKAFKKAFTNNEKVGLVIKSKKIIKYKNPLFVESFTELEKMISEDKRIILINENISRPQLLGLVKACDCFVSLHRSEGFGINILEALEMGKPAIVTNYSGSKDITDNPKFAQLSYPVDYTLVPVKCPLFNLYVKSSHKEAVWADPNIDHAASQMRKVFEKFNFI